MIKNNIEKIKQKYKKEEIQEIVKFVQEDFERRKIERRPFEAQWQLNINFMLGNQYATITNAGDVVNLDKQYFWQQREVFNHTAPIVESRMSRLSQVRPSMTVVPASNEDKDIYSAKLSRKIVRSLQNRVNVSQILNSGTKWSEICGTAFYKIFWNDEKGNTIGVDENGKKILDGDVDVCLVPPYEIFPDTINEEEIENQNSIVHARAYHVDTIKNLWGIEVEGEDVEVLSLEANSFGGGLGYKSANFGSFIKTKPNHAVVIERYELPTKQNPNGRLIIVCGNELLHISELPFINKKDGKRGYPFVKQIAVEQPNCFFGKSIIERCIPVQRAYNAVKNRKHEFLNRLAMGVLAVEDGSVDTENLEDEGMSPGKILVYRQGSTPPKLMDPGSVPTDLSSEEDRLLQEFMYVSGVSDLMRNSKVLNSQNMSGVALQLLIEQDDSRLSMASDQIKFAVKEIAEQSLRLYKQFATMPRLLKVASNSGDVELNYFCKSDISTDDVVFETENEIGETLAQKRTMVFELLKNGLLFDENGKLDNRARAKALELLGFGNWESAQDYNELHIKKADSENLKMENLVFCEVEEFDDHEIHIKQHINHLIGLELSSKKESGEIIKILKEHIKNHKKFVNGEE